VLLTGADGFVVSLLDFHHYSSLSTRCAQKPGFQSSFSVSFSGFESAPQPAGIVTFATWHSLSFCSTFFPFAVIQFQVSTLPCFRQLCITACSYSVHGTDSCSAISFFHSSSDVCTAHFAFISTTTARVASVSRLPPARSFFTAVRCARLSSPLHLSFFMMYAIFHDLMLSVSRHLVIFFVSH